MPTAAIVDLPDLARDETRRDQCHADALRRELGAQRLRERANSEFAHGIRRRVRRRDVAGYAADQHQPAAALLELRETRFARLDRGEHVRLELATVVLDAELLERPDDAEARVRDGHVEPSVALDCERDGRVEVRAPRD